MPANLFVVGDSATRVNPIAGQGCTKAAVDALTLDHVLRRCPARSVAPDAARRFIDLHKSRVEGMWASTRAHDYQFASTTPLPGEHLGDAALARLRRMNGWFGKAATKDSRIGGLLVDVAGQIQPYGSLLSPVIVFRAAFVHLTGRAWDG